MYKESVIPIGMLEEEKKYWMANLSGGLSELSFVTDFPRSNEYVRKIHKILFKEEMVHHLKRISKNNDLSLFVLLLASFKLLLFKYTGQDEIIVSSPTYVKGDQVDNRNVVLRDFINPGMSFKEVLLTVKQTVADGYKNQGYPVDKILNLLEQENKLNLKRVVMLFENIHGKEFAGAVIDDPGNDIMLSIRDTDEKLEAEIAYNAGIFKDETVKRLLNCYIRILDQVLGNTGIGINELELATGEEKREILYEFNRTEAEYPRGKTATRLFEEQAARTPGHIALRFDIDPEDILEELESREPNIELWDRMAKCRFKKNPYIFEAGVNETVGKAGYKLLKTHRHNSIVANRNMWRVLDLFDGTRSLGAIYSFLQGLHLPLVIYSLKQQDVIELTYEFKDEPEKFLVKDKIEIIRLVKTMFKHHLIELEAFDIQGTGEEKPIPGDWPRDEPPQANLPLNSWLSQDRAVSGARVLFLGDTPGIQTVGLLYMASYLRRNGIKSYCQYYNTDRSEEALKKRIGNLLKEIRPGIAAVSMKWFPHIARVLEICKIVKKFAAEELHYPIKVVVGGNTAAYFAKEIIRCEEVDYLLRGDGEIPLLQLCRGEENISNCLYKKDGIIVENPFNYLEEEHNTGEIYLSHLEEIMLSRFAPLPGTFFIYTHKGCGMDCIYCGGCSSANKKIFNRTKLFTRGVEAVRKDIYEAKKYASTFMFDFDAPNVNLLEYCRAIWEGIDLSSHFAIFTNLIPPTAELMALVNRTFKYVYWNLDMASLSGRHREQLYSLGLVKPQPTDDQISRVFAECEGYDNAEVRINLIAGLPYFTADDITHSDKMLSRILNRYTSGSELHWARLHAEPGAPVVENAAKYGMYSLASSFEDFLKYSRMNFSNEYNVEYYNYPYIYFKDEEFNSKISNFYSETNLKVEKYKKQKREKSNIYHKLSYLELNEKAHRLAVGLRDQGVVNNSIVGIMTGDPQEVAVGILGILKAGGAYLPIEPGIPADRKKYMIEDSNLKILLTGSSYVDNEGLSSSRVAIKPLFPHNREGERGTNPDFTVSTSDLAYVIYTSGTTGSPRGVLIDHHGLVNYTCWRIRSYGLTGEDITLQPLTYVFDGFGSNFYSGLLSGGTLVMIPDSKKGDYRYIREIVKKEGVTNISLVPAMYEILVDMAEGEDLRSLRFVVLAGEKANKNLLEKSLEKNPGIRNINEYGPTEATVTAAANFDMGTGNNAVIGKPIANTRLFIMDGASKIVPVGVPGQLCIQGLGVARGYLNNPGLTYEKFKIKNDQLKIKKGHGVLGAEINAFGDAVNAPSPYALHRSPLYKTGDLARWQPDGKVELLGRMDQQVKIRGYRIEVEEIESQLRRHGKVKDAVVTAREISTGTGAESAGKSLCAYVVSNENLDFSQVKEFLSGKLPGYMIPSYFVQLEKLPLTSNGKLDTKALPLPEIKLIRIAPGSEIEKKLVKIWGEVLGIDEDKIGTNSNFFELGGHSLSANTVAAKVHKEFNVKDILAQIFETPTIKGLAETIKKSEREKYFSIEVSEEKEYYRLSSAQKRLYLLHMMNPANTGYNIALTIGLRGAVEKESLEDTLRKLIKRHDSFRTSFTIVNEVPVQRTHREADFKLEYHENFTSRIDASSGEMVTGWVRPFDLTRAPLLHAGLVRQGENHYMLIIEMHHIITDGVSLEILSKDFMKLLKGEEELPPLRIRYKDFSQWQNAEKEKETFKHRENYWLKEYEGEIPVLNLPIDYPRPVVRGFEGNAMGFQISTAQSSALKTLALEQDSTLFMVLLGAFDILLSKLSSQEDIIVGTPIAGRRHADLDKIVGMFVNTLSLRNYPAGEQTFEEFLRSIRKKTLEAYENQDYQFEDLVDRVAVNRDTGRNPLFDVMFTFNTMKGEPGDTGARQEEISAVKKPGIECSIYNYESGTTNFDLVLNSMESGDNLFFSIQYSTKLFKKETIERFTDYYKKIISIIISEPGISIRDMEILSEDERKVLLYEFNDTYAAYPQDKTLQGLFKEQEEKSPDRIALIGPSQSPLRNHQLTYDELNEKAHRLAVLLRKKYAQPDAIMGIMVERSIEMIIGILGILKSGGAYLPIDPGYPPGRIDFMLTGSGAKVLVTTSNLAKESEKGGSWEGEKFFLEDIYKLPGSSTPLRTILPSYLQNPSHLAYVIYTSGSTGKSKGVLIEHKSIVNTLTWRKNCYSFNQSEIMLQLLSISFDGSLTDIFTPLISGSKLVLIQQQYGNDLGYLSEVITRNGITHFIIVPKLYKMFLEEIPGCLSSLRSVTAAGESFTEELVGEHFGKVGHAKLFNEYGPTENSVCSTMYEFKPDRKKILIGKPISNVSCYILNRYLELNPVGIPGELCVAGSGLARGYLNHPELTREKFVFYKSYMSYRSYKSFNKLYKTGDLARWMPDGNIEFIGRIDRQVKIRGFRIEVGEIENCLLQHSEIREAAVLTREDKNGDKYLCAYIVCDTELSIPGLKEYLSKKLPGYMIPGHFMVLGSLPFTASGKPDFKALPDPVIISGGRYIAPRDKVEEKLVEIWSEVLGIVGAIGIEDNFFELGGHSLKATIMAAKIHKEFEVKVPLIEIFKTPAIRGLATYIRKSAEEKYTEIEPGEKKEYYALSSAQKRLYILNRMEPGKIAYNMPNIIPLPPQFNVKKLKNIFSKLIDRHESFRTSFHMVNDEPVQRIRDAVDFEIEYFDLKNSRKESQAGDSIRNFIRPFDLSAAPLLRVGVLTNLDGSLILLADLHHIISDEISHEILMADFIRLYEDRELKPLRLTYKDYSEWQNRLVQTNAIKKQEAYWLSEFGGEITLFDMPLDYERTAEMRFEGSSIHFEIDDTLTVKLKKCAGRFDVSLMMLLFSVYNILLAAYAGREEIIVGTVAAGRRHADLQNIIGFFVNMLAIKTTPRKEKTFSQYLTEVREKTLNAFENQEFQFEELVSRLDIQREPGRHPFVDVVFVFRDANNSRPEDENNPPRETGRSSFSSSLSNPINISHFDLMLHAADKGDSIDLNIEYSTTLFKRATIEEFSKVYREIIGQVLENEDTGLADIKISHDLLVAKSNFIQGDTADWDL